LSLELLPGFFAPFLPSLQYFQRTFSLISFGTAKIILFLFPAKKFSFFCSLSFFALPCCSKEVAKVKQILILSKFIFTFFITSSGERTAQKRVQIYTLLSFLQYIPANFFSLFSPSLNFN